MIILRLDWSRGHLKLLPTGRWDWIQKLADQRCSDPVYYGMTLAQLQSFLRRG